MAPRLETNTEGEEARPRGEESPGVTLLGYIIRYATPQKTSLEAWGGVMDRTNGKRQKRCEEGGSIEISKGDAALQIGEILAELDRIDPSNTEAFVLWMERVQMSKVNKVGMLPSQEILKILESKGLFGEYRPWENPLSNDWFVLFGIQAIKDQKCIPSEFTDILSKGRRIQRAKLLKVLLERKKKIEGVGNPCSEILNGDDNKKKKKKNIQSPKKHPTFDAKDLTNTHMMCLNCLSI